MARAGISGDQVDYVIMGHVIQAGAGQMTARQAAVKGGVPMSVPALTINKVCLSGLDAIALADQLIGCGEFDIVVAGGMESMTNGPYLLPGARQGYRYGDSAIVDSISHDALYCAFDLMGMGAATEKYNAQARDHPRGAGRLLRPVAPARRGRRRRTGCSTTRSINVEIPQRRGDPITVSMDEGVRADIDRQDARQAPAGLRTGRNDHRRLVVPDLRRRCRRGGDEPSQGRAAGLTVMAEIGAHGVVAGPDPSLQSQPSNAIAKALKREGLSTDDVDLFEINEAFASVAIQSMRDLGVTSEKVNVNGGAISMGHPVGMSGARLILHLAIELKRRGGGLGAAGLCGGGGQGDALLIRVPA